MTIDQKVTSGTSLEQDLHPILTKDGQLHYALNADINGVENNEQLGFIQNTLSNESCYKFSDTYRGFISISGGKTVIFEGTGETSKITLLDNNTCFSKVLLKAACLDFQDDITGNARLTEDGVRLYFGNKNRINFLDIEKIEYKTPISDCQECEDEYDNCFDCESLKIHNHINIPSIKLSEVSGNIPNGSYQLAIAFSNNEVVNSEYFILQDVIKIFNKRGGTSGIAIEFEDCFTTYYDEFQIVLISHREDRATSVQSIGFFDTSKKQHVITEIDEVFYSPLPLDSIYQRGVYYEGAGGFVQNSESLVLVKPCTKIPFDYRELATQIEIEIVAIAVDKEEAHKYPSLLRDEVYTVDISWTHIDGEETSRYHVNAKTELNIDLNGVNHLMTDEAPASPDHFELLGTSCDQVRKKIFDIYNNSTIELGDVDCANCKEVEVASGLPSYWESQETYPNDYPADLGCTPIRHPKMPDDCKVPIAKDGCIIILALRLKNVPTPIDCNGNEVEVLGYNVYISDRANHKSILHKGLLYNMGVDDSDDCKDVYYPNFPFNDVSPNKFLSSRWEKGSPTAILTNPLFNNLLRLDPEYLENFSNDRFTYHSPDIHYVTGGRTETLKIYTEAIGKVQGKFHYTEHYPKYQILSSFGTLVTQLAGFVETAIALNGLDTKTTHREESCETHPERKERVEGFPTPNISGGSLINGLMAGSGNINTNITTNVATTNYDVITEADADCDSDGVAGYTATGTTAHNGQNIAATNIPLLSSEEGHKCYIVGETDAPDIAIATVCFTPFEGSEQECHSGPVNGGEFRIEIPLNCEDAFGQVGVKNNMITFTPECDCQGTKKITSSQEETHTESKGDFINRLPDTAQLPAAMFYYLEGQGASHNFLKSLLKPTNYAVQLTTEAEYDHHEPVCTIGNRRRELVSQRYMQPINQIINEDYINNWCRSSSDYMKLGESLLPTTNIDTTRVLHSDFCEEAGNCEGVSFSYNSTIDGQSIQAVSYYVGVTQYKPSQYGQLNDYNSRKVGDIQKLGENSDVIYAGDVFITKMSVKRKMPLWRNLPLNLPLNTDWDMRDYPNLARPTFWLNSSMETVIEDVLETTIPIFGAKLKDYSLDAVESLGECYGPLTKFFVGLQELGLGLFGSVAAATLAFITSPIGGSFINPFKLNGVFYTHVTGTANFWVESEFQSSYRECNELNQSKFYPEIDLEEGADSLEYHLPEQFLYNLHYNWNGISKDTNRLDEFDCCLKTLNLLAYSTKADNQQEGDEWLNFPPLNYHRFASADGPLTVVKEIDDYNLFVGFEDAAYVTQLDEGLLTANGNTLFVGSPDAFKRRLKKISTDSTGYGGIIDPEAVVMTRYGLMYPDRKRKKWLMYNGQLQDVTGSMSSWFQEYMNGEIKGVYDNYTDNFYFTDKSTGWTLSYKPMIKDWLSFHSWIPNSYITASNTFLTTNDKGFWRHNKKGSYQRYYGETHRFEVGIIIQQPQHSTISDIKVFSEWYQNKGYDAKIYSDNKFFDEIIVHNNCGSTNILPIKIGNKELPTDKVVTATNVSCEEWNINQITSNVKVQPYVQRESNGWEYKDSYLQMADKPLAGRYFKIHLRSNNHTEFKKLVQITLSKLNILHK